MNTYEQRLSLLWQQNIKPLYNDIFARENITNANITKPLRWWLTYFDRVNTDFSSIWNTISEDVNKAAMSTKGDPLQWLFSPLKWPFYSWNLTDTQFYWKTVPTAFWAWTRWVLSPLSSLFTWFSTWEDQWEPSVLWNALWVIWWTFEWVQSWVSKLWEVAWLEKRYSDLLAEWIVNIWTWEIWEAWLARLSRWTKIASKAEKVAEYWKVIADELDSFDVPQSYFVKQNSLKRANEIFTNFNTKVDEWVLTRQEYINTKKELSNLWIRNTDYFTERWNEQFSSSKIKDIATEKTLSDIDITSTKSKILEWYNNPDKAPKVIKIVDKWLEFTSDDLLKIKALTNNKVFSSPWFEMFNLPSLPPLDKWVRSVLKWTKQEIKNELDRLGKIRDVIFEWTDELIISKISEANVKWEFEQKIMYDSETNPFKREPLIEALDRWLITAEQVGNKYSFTLTKRWKEVSKKIWFTDEWIEKIHWKPYHHTVEAIDNFIDSKFTFPDVINNKLLNEVNDLKNNPNADYVTFKSKVRKLNNEAWLKFDKLITEAREIKDLVRIVKSINEVAANMLIKSEDFKPFKIKWISDTKYLFKNIPADIVWKLDKRTSWFNLRKNKIIEEYTNRLNKLRTKFSKNKDKLILSIKNEIDKKNKAIIDLKLRHNMFWSIKSDRLKEISLLVSNWKILWDVNNAIKKVVSTNSWNKINTVEQLKKQFEKLDKEIAEAHTKGLQNKITKELKSVATVNKWTSKSYRMSHTPEIEEMLLRIKEVWKANKSWYVNIDELNSLLSDIKELSSESRKVAKQFEIERSNLIEWNISKIKEEWIKNTYWSDDLERTVWTKNKLLAYMWDWKNASTFMYNSFWEIFWHTGDWKMSKGVEIFSANPSIAINKMNNWMEKKTKPLADLVVNKLWDLQDDWWTAMVARQIDNSKSNPYIWFDRIENSPSLKEIYYVDRISPIKEKPSWISDDIRENIKNKKLWEIVERMEYDKDWIEVKDSWNEYHNELWSRYDSIVKQFDWIKLSKRDDYFTLVTEWQVKDFQFNEQDTLWKSYIANKSANETVSTTKGARIDYNTNPINALLYWNRPTVLQSFLREPFEEMVQTYLWKQRKFKTLTEEQRIQLLNKVNEKWEFIYRITDKYWKDLSGSIIKTQDELDKFISNSELNIEDIYITNIWWGIRKDMNKSTTKLINEYIEKFARWWTIQTNWTERLISSVVNQVGANVLAFSPSSIAQQPLSLFHQMAIMWVRKTLRNLKDVFNNPDLIKNAENASSAVRSRKWDNFMFAEILEKTYENNAIWKIKEVLRKYNEIGLYPMRIVDEKVYASIWIWAYREWMQKNWFTFTGDFLKEDWIKYADLMADKIAWTTNKINVPPLFNNLFWQTLFKLASTKINEWQTIKFHTLDAFKKGNTEKWLKTIWIYTASNLAQAWIVYWVAKALYWLWLTNFDPDKNWNLIEQIFSLEGAYDLTVGNTPIWMKVGWVTNFWTLSIMDSLSDKIWKSLKEIKSWEEMQGIIDFIQIFIWWKPIWYTEELLKKD